MFGFRKDPKRKLKQALGDFELPVFPAAVLSGLAAVRDPDAPIARIADAIQLDPGLSARILTRVNSPAFGCRREVLSLRHAVSMLGRGPLESLLVAAGVQQAIPKHAVEGFEPERFWAAASRRASVAGALAAELHPRTRPEAVTAALLQDMALPFLAIQRPKEYGPLLTATQGAPELAAQERAAFGWDHAEVAGWLCESWRFPPGLASAISGHHGEEAPAAVRLVGLLDDDGDDIETLLAGARACGIAATRAAELVEDALNDVDLAA